MGTLTDDLQQVTEALASIEDDAAALPWSKENPWLRRTHIGTSDGRVELDLHGLSVRLALEVVERLLTLDLQCGGFLLVTGRGRHTGGRSRLREAVLGRLDASGYAFHPVGPGRVRVITDAERARRSQPGLGILFWLVVLLAIAGVVAAIVNRVAP